jgi:hypothetical protein
MSKREVLTAMGKLNEFLSLGRSMQIPYHQMQVSTSEWLGLRRANVPANPFNTLRRVVAQYRAGEEKMAYEERADVARTTGLGGQLMKPRTFREQMQDQIAYHKSKIANLEAVLESMTPEVEKFVEALQKAEL